MRHKTFYCTNCNIVILIIITEGGCSSLLHDQLGVDVGGAGGVAGGVAAVRWLGLYHPRITTRILVIKC